MRVFITGGAGLIGTFLTRDLLSRDHDVVIYDSFVNYSAPGKPEYSESIDTRMEWIDRPKTDVIRGDTRNKVQLYRAIEGSQPDCVVHLAGLPIADICKDRSEEAVSSILNGTANVLEAVRDVGTVDRFVYASSSMIYGDFRYRPADEAHPKDPKSVYGGAKYAGETITKSFAKQYDFEHVIVRPSAVYGPTDTNHRVSQIFVERMLNNEPIELHGGGTQKLDFTYVEDTARGFSLATTREGAANETFNITRGEGRSIRELAAVISEYTGPVDMIETAAEMERPKRGALDIQKARDKLGYEPQYSLEEGIEKYVSFVRNVNAAPELNV